MDYGRAWATIDGESEITIVVFGQDNGPALLGAYQHCLVRTRLRVSLAVDPVAHHLKSTAMIMY